MPLQFQLLEHENHLAPLNREHDAYYRRAASRARLHCLCGRFARPGRPPQMDHNGEYPYTVNCAACGEVRIV